MTADAPLVPQTQPSMARYPFGIPASPSAIARYAFVA
jgi:hypothetical protein